MIRTWTIMLLAAPGCHLALGYSDLDFGDTDEETTSETPPASNPLGNCTDISVPEIDEEAFIGEACLNLPQPVSHAFTSASDIADVWMVGHASPESRISWCDSGVMTLSPDATHEFWFESDRSILMLQRTCEGFAASVDVTIYNDMFTVPSEVRHGAGMVLINHDSWSSWLMVASSMSALDPLDGGRTVLIEVARHSNTPTEAIRETYAGGAQRMRLGLCYVGGAAVAYAGDTIVQQLDAAHFSQQCCLDVGLTANRYQQIDETYLDNEPLTGAFRDFRYTTVTDITQCDAAIQGHNP